MYLIYVCMYVHMFVGCSLGLMLHYHINTRSQHTIPYQCSIILPSYPTIGLPAMHEFVAVVLVGYACSQPVTYSRPISLYSIYIIIT